jgi:hypothetical protein
VRLKLLTAVTVPWNMRLSDLVNITNLSEESSAFVFREENMARI